MPKHPLISIPLDIPDIRVLQTEITKAGEFILTVESTLTSTTCRRCGRTITTRHGLDQPRLLRHLPILGRVVLLRIRPKRFRCPYCDDHPTTTQQLDWYEPTALHTKAYERHLIVQLTTIFDTARSKKDGLRRITFWRQRVEKSGLRCFDGFLKLLERWVDLIANYFIKHQTSGFVEGLNTKLKVLKRRCYGLRNVVRLFQRLMLDVEGYRRFSPWRSPISSAAHGNS
jgi:transposase